MSACVGVLKPRLGNQWTNSWQAVGFTSGSLAVPSEPLPLLQLLRGYFESNPTHEVPNVTPTVSITAAACEAAAQAISSAITASNQADTNAGNAQAALDAGFAQARARLTGLREELTQLLGPEIRFGMPSASISRAILIRPRCRRP